jgi:hypothetical protein
VATTNKANKTKKPGGVEFNHADGHEISLYWAGKARLRRTVMRRGDH